MTNDNFISSESETICMPFIEKAVAILTHTFNLESLGKYVKSFVCREVISYIAVIALNKK